jgi:hypothetical protein
MNYMKLIIGIAAGALVGFLYYKFVGCRSGVCPITSNPYSSMIYGSLMGLLISRM